jgi:hypothetical protein
MEQAMNNDDTPLRDAKPDDNDGAWFEIDQLGPLRPTNDYRQLLKALPECGARTWLEGFVAGRETAFEGTQAKGH